MKEVKKRVQHKQFEPKNEMAELITKEKEKKRDKNDYTNRATRTSKYNSKVGGFEIDVI